MLIIFDTYFFQKFGSEDDANSPRTRLASGPRGLAARNRWPRALASAYSWLATSASMRSAAASVTSRPAGKVCS